MKSKATFLILAYYWKKQLSISCSQNYMVNCYVIRSHKKLFNSLNAVKSAANELPPPGRGKLLFGIRLTHSVVSFGYDRNHDEKVFQPPGD